MAKNAKAAGPSWKPAKSSTDGNYGKAVSDAAKAKPETPSSDKKRSAG